MEVIQVLKLFAPTNQALDFASCLKLRCRAVQSVRNSMSQLY
jgi:hypothetical protein